LNINLLRAVFAKAMCCCAARFDCCFSHRLLSLMAMGFEDIFRLAAAYVFEGIGVFQVGLAVFCGRYKYLLDHMVMPHKPASSEEQEMYVLSLRERLKPVARNKKA
jgi:hypothetical protein